MDRMVTHALETFTPNDEYMVRDIIFDPASKRPVFVERTSPSPVTDHVQYREIRHRQAQPALERPLTNGISRWYNPYLRAGYEYHSGQPIHASFQNVRYIDVDYTAIPDSNFGDVGFSLLRPAIEPVHEGNYTDAYVYNFYFGNIPNNLVLACSIPDTATLVANAREDIGELLDAYLTDPAAYLSRIGIDPDDIRPSEERLLREIRAVQDISAREQITIADAITNYVLDNLEELRKDYIEDHNAQLNSLEAYQQAHQLLAQFITRISTTQ